MTDETAKKVAHRLNGDPSCPECGYVPKEGEKLHVSDWNLHTGTASVSNVNELSNPHFEPSEIYKNEDMVMCPKCECENSKRDWGLEWSWE